MFRINYLKVFTCAALIGLIGCSNTFVVKDLPAADGNTQQNVPPTEPPVVPAPIDQLKDLRTVTESYQNQFNLGSADQKLVNNRGDGFDSLYGTRNFRMVLRGIYYRGGANNTYNKILVRDNMNPLQDQALANLCENGFSEALYLYSENYKTAPPTTNCKTLQNENHTLAYNQMTALTLSNQEKFIQKIYQHIKNPKQGPLYGHCWNGWHASGMIAAISLRQFCGWSATQAEEYWVRNTDGNEAGYDSVRKRVRDFQPYAQYLISPAEQALICPAP